MAISNDEGTDGQIKKASGQRISYYTSPEELDRTDAWFWDHTFWDTLGRRTLNLEPGVQVLDLGSGTGSLGRRMYPHIVPDGRIVGIDIDSESVIAGNKLNQRMGFSELHLIHADVRDVEEHFDAQTFDVVTEVGLLSNLTSDDDRARTLSDVRRLLKPGGRFGSLELDFTALVGLESSLVEDARKFNEAIARGVATETGGDMRLGVRMPSLMVSAGFEGIGVWSYIAPEPMPPYAAETIDLVERYRGWFDSATEEHSAYRPYLELAMDATEIDALCQRLHSAWSDRIALMERGIAPSFFSQVFFFTVGSVP